MTTNKYINAGAQDALNRMRRASNRKTGCHLTAEMIEGLSRTSIGEIWDDDDPRETKPFAPPEPKPSEITAGATIEVLEMRHPSGDMWIPATVEAAGAGTIVVSFLEPRANRQPVWLRLADRYRTWR